MRGVKRLDRLIDLELPEVVDLPALTDDSADEYCTLLRQILRTGFNNWKSLRIKGYDFHTSYAYGRHISIMSLRKFFDIGIRPDFRAPPSHSLYTFLCFPRRVRDLLNGDLFTLAECEALLVAAMHRYLQQQEQVESFQRILDHVVKTNRELAPLLTFRDTKSSTLCSSLACAAAEVAVHLIDNYAGQLFDLNYRYEGRPVSFFVTSLAVENALTRQGVDMNQRADNGQTREEFWLQNPGLLRGEEGQAYFYRHFKYNHPGAFNVCPEAILRLESIDDSASFRMMLRELADHHPFPNNDQVIAAVLATGIDLKDLGLCVGHKRVLLRASLRTVDVRGIQPLHKLLDATPDAFCALFSSAVCRSSQDVDACVSYLIHTVDPTSPLAKYRSIGGTLPAFMWLNAASLMEDPRPVFRLLRHFYSAGAAWNEPITRGGLTIDQFLAKQVDLKSKYDAYLLTLL